MKQVIMMKCSCLDREAALAAQPVTVKRLFQTAHPEEAHSPHGPQQ